MHLNFENETWTIATNENTHIHEYMEKNTHTLIVLKDWNQWKCQCLSDLYNRRTTHKLFTNISVEYLYLIVYSNANITQWMYLLVFYFVSGQVSSFIERLIFFRLFLFAFYFFSFCKHLSATISLMWIQNIRNMYLLLSLDKIYTIYSL